MQTMKIRWPRPVSCAAPCSPWPCSTWPVLAPILVVVILFDYIMSRVRAADADGLLRTRFTRMARIDLLVMVVTLLFWIPYFIWIL